MVNIMFEPDSYEMDLALMMLEILVKKKEISFHTYKTVKKKMQKDDEDDDKSSNVGTSENADEIKKLQGQLYR